MGAPPKEKSLRVSNCHRRTRTKRSRRVRFERDARHRRTRAHACGQQGGHVGRPEGVRSLVLHRRLRSLREREEAGGPGGHGQAVGGPASAREQTQDRHRRVREADVRGDERRREEGEEERGRHGREGEGVRAHAGEEETDGRGTGGGAGAGGGEPQGEQEAQEGEEGEEG